MSTRCTPFGFFGGISLGEKRDRNQIKLKGKDTYVRVSKFDMDFLCSLSQDFLDDYNVRNELFYFPNNSLYVLGDKLRYTESRYINNRKQNTTSSIDNSYYVSLILDYSKRGAKIEELAALIVEEDVTVEEAKEFINQLIDEQIIISSIYPSITGEDYFSLLKSELNRGDLGMLLRDLDSFLQEINDNNSSKENIFLENYFNLYDFLHAKKINFNKKTLIQTDLIVNTQSNFLSESVFKKVDNALKVLNKLSVYEESENLKIFKSEFYKRYEDQEVPLSIVLDVESGIGYPPLRNEVYEISPLVDDFFAIKSNEKKNNGLSRKDYLLNSKLVECLKSNKEKIILKDEDLSGFVEKWDDLPSTFSVFINVLNENDLIKINEVGSITATSMLGRFSNVDEDVNEFVQGIIRKENELCNENELLVEIAHLPEKSVGNILSRPHLRDYEIPFLSLSSFPEENQITIDDIYISIKENHIFLRSKKTNKIISPRLASAHNFNENNLPFYLFLCDVQSQGVKDEMNFDWGNVYKLYDFFPRVVYDDVILSPRTWFFKSNELKKLKCKDTIDKWKNEFNIPNKLFIKEYDNELYIDFENELMLHLFLSEIKNKSQITLIENLFNEEKALVLSESGEKYTNEILISYYKDKMNGK